MPLAIKSTGGGSVTLTAPSTASDLTVTLPSSSGTILTSATGSLPAGTVVQVASAVKTSTASTASITYADLSGLSVSITPSKSTSKILVLYTINCSHNVNTGIWVEARRDTTSISTNWGYYGQPTNFTYSGFPMTIAVLDSPSTTSAITYSLRWRSDVNGFTSYLNRSENGGQTGFSSTITVMEVLG